MSHTTSTSLLVRLREPTDREAWSRFVRLYGPLIFKWARRVGLGTDDAADLVQDVMLLMVRKLPQFEYDGSKSFRSWLKTVTINKWRERCRRRGLPMVDATNRELAEVCDPISGDFWGTEYRQQVVARAMELMQNEFQPATWQACRRYVLGEGSPEELAQEYGISVWTVYSAKSRLIKRLREELGGLLD